MSLAMTVVGGAHVVSAATPAVGALCSSRVAVLGADLTPAGRASVRRDLGLGPSESALTESLADERAQAHGLIPPTLLGQYAVSSVLLRPLPPGAGIDVALNPHITLDSAQAYANALLTAGVGDAAVRVAAPLSQRALGTTALLGMLRAARLSCRAATQPRQDLAVREFVLTDQLAVSAGYAAAPLLMARLKSDAAAGHVTTPDALATLIGADAAKLRTAVPATLQPAIGAYLRDLAVTHVYDDVAAAAPQFGGAPPVTAAVRFARPPGAGAPSNGATGATGAQGNTYHGTAAAGAGAALALQQQDGLRQYRPAPSLQVFRDGKPSTFGAIQRGDTVTVTTNAAGSATRIDATSTRTRAGQNGPATDRGAVVHGTIVAAPAGASTLAVQERGGTRTYHVAPALQVYRDGKPSSLNAIRQGDSVAVTTDASGRATRVDATSHAGSGNITPGGVAPGAIHRGTAAAVVGAAGAAAAAGVALREGTATRTYRSAPGAQVYRDGKPATLGAIKSGDTVTVTTNGAGQATRIDATSHAGAGSPAPGASTGAGRGGIASGTVAAAAGAAGLAIHEQSGTRAFRTAPGLQVYRDARPSALAALRPADKVTVRYDATGAATRIDATSAQTGAGKTGAGQAAAGGTGHGAVYRGTAAAVVAAGAGALAIHQGDGAHTYHAAPGLQVYRDGKPSSLNAIRQGDSVAVTTDASGRATRVDATSHAAAPAGAGHGGIYHGTVAAAVAAGASALAVKEAGATRTRGVAPGAPVYRDGKQASLGDLRATDTVTGTTNAAGVTTRIDATSARVAVANPGVNPLWPTLGALAALAALLLLLPLLFRRRRRRNVVTTTTTTIARGAAVIPTLERPASEPIRDRLHDGKDIAD